MKGEGEGKQLRREGACGRRVHVLAGSGTCAGEHADWGPKGVPPGPSAASRLRSGSGGPCRALCVTSVLLFPNGLVSFYSTRYLRAAPAGALRISVRMSMLKFTKESQFGSRAGNSLGF